MDLILPLGLLRQWKVPYPFLTPWVIVIIFGRCAIPSQIYYLQLDSESLGVDTDFPLEQQSKE